VYDLLVKVVKIKGRCPVFKEGEEFELKKGFLISGKICLHALASMLTVLQALARGDSGKRIGLSKEHGKAIVQCPDPFNTVTFEITRLNGPEERIKKDIEEFDKLKAEEFDKGIYEMALRYRKDAEHFLEKGDFLSAFGCINYAFGLLDAKKYAKEFKKNQTSSNSNHIL